MSTFFYKTIIINKNKNLFILLNNSELINRCKTNLLVWFHNNKIVMIYIFNKAKHR